MPSPASRFRTKTFGLVLLSALALANAVVHAQTPPPPAASESGIGPRATKPADVDPGQNMILPSAGASATSAAPTMVYDCKAKPLDCTPAATQADKANVPEVSQPPATSGPKKE